MNRNRATRAALVLAAAALVASCSATPASDQTVVAHPSSGTLITAAGFPLDRSLSGVAGYPDLGAVLMVTNPVKGASYWSTPDGGAPAYIREGRNQTADEAKTLYSIMTPVTATVAASMRGTFKPGDHVTLVFVGGTVGDVTIRPDQDIAPDMAALLGARRLLVGGPVSGSTVSAYFVYSVGDGERVKSLLGSASAADPDFTIGDLVSALAARK